MFSDFFGLAKGIYDANIWASMYDVVHPSRRATMLGLANMIGWFGAGCGTTAIGVATTRWGVTMGQALASTAGIYAVVAVLLILAGAVFAPRDHSARGKRRAQPSNDCLEPVLGRSSMQRNRSSRSLRATARPNVLPHCQPNPRGPQSDGQSLKTCHF